MLYRPTLAECRHIFRLVNCIAFNNEIVEPTFTFPKQRMRVFAQVDCGPGIVEIARKYSAYSLFMRVVIHEIGHLWVWHNVGNKRETHGKNFRRYCDIIEQSFNGLQVFEIPWINTIKETKDNE